MYVPDPNDPVHPLLKATVHLEDSFNVGLRGELINPLRNIGPEDEYSDLWHEAEKASQAECERVIKFWIVHRHLPGDIESDALFFLCKRFDAASDFIQNLFLDQRDTPFSYPHFSTNEILGWLLIPWWEEHGIRESFWPDLVDWEQKTFPSGDKT